MLRRVRTSPPQQQTPEPPPEKGKIKKKEKIKINLGPGPRSRSCPVHPCPDRTPDPCACIELVCLPRISNVNRSTRAAPRTFDHRLFLTLQTKTFSSINATTSTPIMTCNPGPIVPSP